MFLIRNPRAFIREIKFERNPWLCLVLSGRITLKISIHVIHILYIAIFQHYLSETQLENLPQG